MTYRAQGMRAWLLQRLSGMYLALCCLLGVIAGFGIESLDYREWMDFISQPLVSVAVGLFFASLLIHAWVGIRDVLVDYVSAAGIRVVLLLGIAFSLFALGFWVVLILASVVKI